jgi:UDPglucose 6-dehydrogenase
VTVAFCGMTHLGLVSAAAAAELGVATLAFDPDAALIAHIKAGALPVHEPGLSAAKLRLTAAPSDLTACDVVYIAPDVPTSDDGQSDIAPLTRLIEAVLPHVRRDATIVVLSQVPPGFTRKLWQRNPRFFYQVETLVFGQAVERATKPERIIVGCADPAQTLPAAYAAFLATFKCPILPMRFESAELAKISINLCLAATLSITNTLAELCEAVGADWGEIAPALRLDRRIGAHAYLNAGLGIGGGNIGRDIATVLRLGAEHGADTSVAQSWLGHSKRRRDWPLSMLAETAAAQVGILGLAYKEDTASMKNSPALALIEALGGARVAAYDPAVNWQDAALAAVHRAEQPLDACSDADAIAIMTPWRQFRDLAPADIADAMRGTLVLDPYRMLDHGACAAAGLDHRVLGRA